MGSWVAMQRGHRAPHAKLLSLLVQVLHQALTQRFVPSTKGMKRDKRGDSSLTHRPLRTASAGPSCTPQRCPPGKTEMENHEAGRVKVVP